MANPRVPGWEATWGALDLRESHIQILGTSALWRFKLFLTFKSKSGNVKHWNLLRLKVQRRRKSKIRVQLRFHCLQYMCQPLRCLGTTETSGSCVDRSSMNVSHSMRPLNICLSFFKFWACFKTLRVVSIRQYLGLIDWHSVCSRGTQVLLASTKNAAMN